MNGVLSLRETPGAPAPRDAPSSEPAREPAGDLDEGGRIVCAACGSFVTSAGAKASVEGRHQHRFMNPAGLSFEIACFSRAPGTAGMGESSSVWTWFPGYSWRAVVCRACALHLGWSYSRGADGFFGLITERVIELPSHPEAD